MDAQIHNDQSSMSRINNGQPDNSNESELFTRHNDTVLCCSVDKSTRLAVSGGIDDTAFVWDLYTKHVIFECLGHKESVVAAAFSLNSTYVATGDLNGFIQVRNTTTGIKVFEFDIDEINWILWHNTSEYILLAGTAKGDFWMWNVNDPAAVKTFTSYGSSSTVAKLMSDGLKAIVSYQDGSVRVFDLKTGQSVLCNQDPNKSEIISMDLNPKKSIVAVGCIDSSVKLITDHNMKLIGTLSCKTPESVKTSQADIKPSCDKSQDYELMEDEDRKSDCSNYDDDEVTSAIKLEPVEVIDEYSNTQTSDYKQEIEDDDDDLDGDSDDENDSDSVESVLFSPCGSFLAAANNSGTITIWDVSTQVKRCELHTGVGITRAAWAVDGSYISGHLDGTIRIYDINLIERKKIVAHKDQILDLALRNNILVTASEDKTLRVTQWPTSLQ